MWEDWVGESVSRCKCPQVASGISVLATIYQVSCTHPEGMHEQLNNYVLSIMILNISEYLIPNIYMNLLK